MVTITTTYTNEVLYILLSIFLLYILITYKREFKTEALIEYFLYLTNKILLFVMFVTCIFLGIFSLVNLDPSILETFLTDSIEAIFYYCLINYSVIFLVFLVKYFSELAKKNDLFAFAILKESNFFKGEKGK